MAIRIQRRKKKSESENNWAARSRLRRIEYLLWWRGWVRRGDLIRDFGVSIAQTSSDLQRYHGLNEGGMVYNLSTKRYEASPRMACRLFEPSLDEAVREFFGEGTSFGGVPYSDASPSPSSQLAMLEVPVRRIDKQVARRVMIALLGKLWLSVKYHSLSSGKVARRKLAPGGLAWDGSRWHLRAFCDERKQWLDFVLGRMASAEWPEDDLPTDLPNDEDWHGYDTVKLTLNPALDNQQQEALRMDYGLAGNSMELRVRKAMKPYLMASLYLDVENGDLPRHFVTKNPKTNL